MDLKFLCKSKEMENESNGLEHFRKPKGYKGRVNDSEAEVCTESTKQIRLGLHPVVDRDSNTRLPLIHDFRRSECLA
jgi:hypothetical protein